MMSPYDTVVAGKLKLKGKALNVKACGVKKKKKRDKRYHHLSQTSSGLLADHSLDLDGDALMLGACLTINRAGGNMSTNLHEDSINEADKYDGKDNGASYDGNLTPAERRFLQQTEKLELQRLAKMASRSHRDRIQQFNYYLANLSEHYDIPKVGPG
ncbi:hypothetical protein Fmac_000833 [Flemingia macrophylla]|uniref:Protein FAM32A-like n=1 Tax=Flemingia macrophylla TaxID=520843 RepID=A0ABD1NGZ6_9FABA